MKKALSVTVPGLLLLAAALTGCGAKDPEAVCTQLDALAEKSDAKDSLFGGKDKKTAHEKCVKKFTALKAAAPDSYKKMASCAGESSLEKAMACVIPIAMTDPGIKKAEEQERADEAKEKAAKLLKVVDLPLKAQDVSMKTYGGDAINFSASWPDGMEKDTKNTSETMLMYSYKLDKDEEFGTSASLTITSGGKPSIDDETKYMDAKTKIDKKDSRADGFTLASSDEYSVTVKTAKAKGDESSVECTAHMFGKEAVDSKDKIEPWLEKLCTLTIK